MTIKREHAIQNNLLKQLSDPDLALLEPHLEHVILARGNVLLRPMEPFRYAYFVTSGLVSVIASTNGHEGTEIGVYGFEGVGSTASVLGSDRCPYQHVVQIAGTAMQASLKHLSVALDASPSLAALLHYYVHVFNVQTAYTAVANAEFVIGQRLARWLLMCQDRTGRVDLHFTHEFLAIMLGVRRAGVTEAINELEGEKIIRAVRGRISILNRDRLVSKAGSSYGIPEAEYRRLIGPLDIFATD